MYLLGIDAGTSVVKVALFDEGGQELASTSHPTPVFAPAPGWSETSMTETWQMTAVAINDLLARTSIGSAAVKGVGITGNMIGAWLIDAEGQPVRTAILWNDSRTTAMLARFEAEQPGFMARIYDRAGSVMQQGCTLPLVRWLHENEPQTLARTAHVLCCKDWIRYKLTGTLHTDPTEAVGMPGDTRRRDYDEDLFAWLGLEAYRHLWPPIASSEAVVGHISDEAADQTGLLAGTPVIAGAGDVPACALGAGAVTPGVAFTILGTTCLNGLVLPEPSFSPRDVGLLFPLPRAGWLRVMANIAGTTNLDWAIAQWCASERASIQGGAFFDWLEEQVQAHTPPGADGALYHPYLSGAGVIAPVVAAGARAQFTGLLPEHSRWHMMRAVYEGVALAMRDCYTAMDAPLTEFRLVGGGARSPFWCQLIADCVGVPVLVPDGQEFGARGAALLAGVGIGWYRDLPAISARIAINRRYTPDEARHAQYEPVYARYRAVREALTPLWR